MRHHTPKTLLTLSLTTALAAILLVPMVSAASPRHADRAYNTHAYQTEHGARHQRRSHFRGRVYRGAYRTANTHRNVRVAPVYHRPTYVNYSAGHYNQVSTWRRPYHPRHWMRRVVGYRGAPIVTTSYDYGIAH